MNFNIANVAPRNVSDDVLDVVNKEHARALANYIGGAHIVKYYLTAKEFDEFAAIMSPVPIAYAHASKLTRHPHPIPKMLSDMAHERCADEANDIFGGKAIDVGGVPNKTPHSFHCCPLVNDSRTFARMLTGSLLCNSKKRKLPANEASAFSNASLRLTVCTNGAENCAYQAEYGYMVNVYDITPDTLVKIFRKHNLRVMDVYMYLPTCLIDKRFKDDYTHYQTKIIGDQIFFTLNDASNAYQHRYDDWKFWATATGIECTDGSLQFEQVQQWGTFTHIRIVKTPCVPCTRLIRKYHVHSYTDKYMVPNVLDYFVKGDYCRNFFISVFYVEKHFVDSVLDWATRQADNAYNYPAFAQYADSKSINVFYTVNGSQQLVYRGIAVDATVKDNLKASLYVIGAAMRFRRTQVVGKMLTKMGDCKGTLDAFKHWFRSTMASVFDHLNAYLNDKSCAEYLEEKYARIERSSETYLPMLHVALVPEYYGGAIYICDSPVWRDHFGPITVKLLDNQPLMGDGTAPISVSADVEFRSNSHYEILFDPPADGKCGVHAVRYFLNNVPMPSHYGNPKRSFPEAWLSSDDLLEWAKFAKFNLLIHDAASAGAGLSYFAGDGQPSVKLLLQDVHWYAIKCDCKIMPRYIGAYDAIKLHQGHLYVNCANQHCTDGGGQALAFANMFPGYVKQVKLPVTNTQFVQYRHANGNVYHLAIAVAHCVQGYKTKEEIAAVNRKLAEITVDISSYALANGLTVYMPLIGSAIYRNDLCCVKKWITTMQCKYVECHYNEQSAINYDNTMGCRHSNVGGYGLLARPSNKFVLDVNDPYDSIDYLLIAPDNNRGRMNRKFDDILEFLKDIAPGRPLSIIELSAAPGHFATIARKRKLQYTALHYEHGDFKPFDGVTFDFTWSTTIQLIDYLDENVTSGQILLLDHCLAANSPLHAYMRNLVTNRNCLFLCKTLMHDFDDAAAVFRIYEGLCVSAFHNDGSSPLSSEVYYSITQTDVNTTLPAVVSASKALLTIDRDNLKKQLDTVCSCVAGEEHINAKLTWKVDVQQFKLFLRNLAADDYLTNSYVKINPDGDLPKLYDTIEASIGVAGCGKTSAILEKRCAACALVITPFKAIATANNASSDVRSVTYMKAFHILNNRGHQFKYIYLDEFYCMNPYLYSVYKKSAPNARFVALGDPKQITNRDYDKCAPTVNTVMTAIMRTKTKRVPDAVCALLQNYVPGIHHAEKKPGTVARKLALPEVDPTNKHCVVMCHTQKVKAALAKRYNNVITVNESQGMTFQEVHLFTPDIEFITKDQQSFVYTALSRTSDRIVFYGEDQQIERYLSIIQSPVESALATPMAGNVVPVTDVESKTITNAVPQSEPLRTLAREIVSTDTAEEVLRVVHVPKNQHMTQDALDVRLNLLPENLSKNKVKLSDGWLRALDVKINGAKIQENTKTVRMYPGHDMLGTVQTYFKRYLGRKQTPKQLNQMLAKLHMRGLNTFMREKRYRSALTITNDDKWKSVLNYLLNLQRKFKDAPNQLPDPKVFDPFEAAVCNEMVSNPTTLDELESIFRDYRNTVDNEREKFLALYHRCATGLPADIKRKVQELSNQYWETQHRICSSHMKMQPKEVRELYFDTADKAGQGVTCFTKLANAICSGYQKRVHDWVMENLLSNVQWAVDCSDLVVSTWFKPYLPYFNRPDYCQVTNDFSEFDASQRIEGVECIATLMEEAGVDKTTADYFRDQRAQFIASGFSIDAGTRLSFDITCSYMQTSGHLFTLTGNTIFNMAALGACVQFDDIICASFKGDDSIVLCSRYSERTIEGLKIAELCGYKLKLKNELIPEYIANLVTNIGFVPDYIRRCSRLIGKVYTHPEQWAEMKKSMADALQVVTSGAQFELGLQLARKHYADHDIHLSVEQIRVLAAYMHRCTYDDGLHPQSKRTFHMLFYDISRCLSQNNAHSVVFNHDPGRQVENM